MTLLTDKQAREQTCPLIRYCYNERDVIADRTPAIYVHQNCQGSDCKIGWRWVVEKEPLTTGQMVAARSAIGLAAALQPDVEPARGYCGAFGKPGVLA